MKKLHLYTALLSLICIYSSGINANDFYKWTDDKGVTHYSQHKPVDAQAEVISTKTPGRKKPPEYIPFSDEEAAAQKNADIEKTKPVEKKAEKTPEKETVAKVEEPKKEKKIKADPAKCKQATQQETLLLATPIARLNGKVMTADVRAEQLKRYKETKKTHCK